MAAVVAVIQREGENEVGWMPSPAVGLEASIIPTVTHKQLHLFAKKKGTSIVMLQPLAHLGIIQLALLSARSDGYSVGSPQKEHRL